MSWNLFCRSSKTTTNYLLKNNLCQCKKCDTLQSWQLNRSRFRLSSLHVLYSFFLNLQGRLQSSAGFSTKHLSNVCGRREAFNGFLSTLLLRLEACVLVMHRSSLNADIKSSQREVLCLENIILSTVTLPGLCRSSVSVSFSIHFHWTGDYWSLFKGSSRDQEVSRHLKRPTLIL